MAANLSMIRKFNETERQRDGVNVQSIFGSVRMDFNEILADL